MLKRIAVLILLVVPVEAGAETIRSGDRIRVYSNGDSQPFVGSVMPTSETDRLLVDGTWRRQLDVGISSIDRLDVSRGTHHRAGQGALVGAIAGAGVGLIVSIEDVDDIPARTVFATSAMAVLGTAMGFVIGALYEGDVWEEIPVDALEIDANAKSSRGRMSMRVSF